MRCNNRHVTDILPCCVVYEFNFVARLYVYQRAAQLLDIWDELVALKLDGLVKSLDRDNGLYLMPSKWSLGADKPP
jgi:hypothetical protein